MAVLLSAPALDEVQSRQTDASSPVWGVLGGYDVHGLIEAEALRNDIPVWFFARLIRQESGFNPQALSPVGAMGIAQFMPATATERGLVNPFDPAQAIPKSAELLKDLKVRFGNLGLAAAAYNAGPQRVQSWLAGRGDLPAETRSYVLAVTGRSVQEWAPQSALASTPASSSREVSGASLFGAAPMTRAAGPPPATTFQDRKLAVLVEAEAQQRKGSRGQRQAKASGEQSLCSLMNSLGSTCIVQKMY
ncbi:transglycosylase SLT domain-containing protein [Microvirga subterranea]|uniref:Transglycosylase-like protein with SLT domain n=1 Tax=Microvirga subterranea TaxID=186651 RepID=A0A370H802_9HYPH|nr:transglycosylase SLT domain-containing protein [Microvirga subterranea]RDI52546.1 transglycosylase-like protein with SLT domain [Microvirga subterranea]